MKKLNVVDTYNEEMRELITTQYWSDADAVLLAFATDYVNGEVVLDDVLDLFNKYAGKRVEEMSSDPNALLEFADANDDFLDGYIEEYGEEATWEDTLREAWKTMIVTDCIGMSASLFRVCVLWELKKAGVESVDEASLDTLEDWCYALDCKAFAESISKEGE